MTDPGKPINRDMYIDAKSELFRLARNMRNNPTESERILWKYLRQFRLEGLVFRRQHPIDFFIVDYFCHKIKIVIEVDGECHLNDQTRVYDDNSFPALDGSGGREGVRPKKQAASSLVVSLCNLNIVPV